MKFILYPSTAPRIMHLGNVQWVVDGFTIMGYIFVCHGLVYERNTIDIQRMLLTQLLISLFPWGLLPLVISKWTLTKLCISNVSVSQFLSPH